MHAPDISTCDHPSQATETRRQIVLFEHDEYIASLLHMLLHREGFDIVAITEQADAAAHIQAHGAPDLIFMDNRWLIEEHPPIIHAFEQAGHWQETPIIMLMSYFQSEKIDYALSLGVTDYILQPFEPGELLDVIRKYI